MKNDVFPYLGSMKLEDLHQMHICELYNRRRLKERKLSGRTIGFTAMILRQAPGAAVSWEILAKNPVDNVSTPTTDRKEMEVLTPEQGSLLLGIKEEAAVLGE